MTSLMSRRLTIVLVSVGVLVCALIGFHLFVAQAIKKSMHANADMPQTVSTATAVMSEWQREINAVGSLRAVRGVDITTEIAGLVRELHFKSGDMARAGQVLVDLNADSDQAQLAALNAAADLSATILKRDQVQYEAQAISKAQLDADAADLKNRRAQAAAQAATVAKKTLRAPFAGRLGITTVNPGQNLNPGDKVVTLQAADPIYADFRLPQRDLASIIVGQDVTVTTDAYPGRSFHGKLTAIDSQVDVTSRNFQAEATLANHDGALVPGMFARAAVAAGTRRRYLTVPQTAITYNPYGATAFVTRRSGTAGSKLQAEQVFVTLGPTRGDQVAVLSGIEAGDQIVTSGQLKLRNGTPLVVDNRVLPTNDPNPAPQEN